MTSFFISSATCVFVMLISLSLIRYVINAIQKCILEFFSFKFFFLHNVQCIKYHQLCLSEFLGALVDSVSVIHVTMAPENGLFCQIWKVNWWWKLFAIFLIVCEAWVDLEIPRHLWCDAGISSAFYQAVIPRTLTDVKLVVFITFYLLFFFLLQLMAVN